ncbi:MAG: HlyD family secretion protein [Pseudomonadota bacterium]|nr:HlyD family secretion protein [Pseudomonadota bacterium]
MAMPKRVKLVSAVLLVGVSAGALLYLDRHESAASVQSTADAYVQADFTLVAPRVPGTIATVDVEDNATVNAGDVLATLDSRDFVIAVNAAHAQVASAEATVASRQARLAQQERLIRQAAAQVAADDAALALARANATRYRNLAADGSGSLQKTQEADAQLDTQLAAREKSQAGLELARQQVDLLGAELQAANAALAQAEAALAAAELALSHTRIVAPVAGTVGQHAARIGAFAAVGKPLLALVPLDALYISANYRETQLARVRVGQIVDIEVDALPGIVLKGRVESLGPASGVSYAAIAPHNATGNFTKIVQRLPVRIHIEPGQPAAASLRVGMSVTPAIHVDE